MTANAWLQSGLQTILLPSGYQVRLVLPDLRRLARNGVLSSHLLDVALGATDDDGEPVEIPAEERDRRNQEYGEIFTRELIWSVRESGPAGEELEPTTLTAEAIENIATDDLMVLEKVITREWTPARASAFSRALLGIITELDAGDGEDLAGYATFRDRRDGPAGGDDGELLADTAEPAAADPGRGRRVRRRRGAGDPARPGSQAGAAPGAGAAEGQEPAGSPAAGGDAVRDPGGPGEVVGDGR